MKKLAIIITLILAMVGLGGCTGSPPAPAATPAPVPTPTLYEYYNTGDDGSRGAYGTVWVAQTFTPATAHKITNVKLKLFRFGRPGTVTVSIKATDGSGHPTGADLCSAIIDGNTLTTFPGQWYEITLGAGYNLAADTKYAIVMRAPEGTVETSPHNNPEWQLDYPSPTYTGGASELSANSGATWVTDETRDYMFEVWGAPSAGLHLEEDDHTLYLKRGDEVLARWSAMT